MTPLRLFFILLFFIFLAPIKSFPQSGKQMIKKKYKKYQKVDLGDLNLEGGVVSPTDITIRETKRTRIKTDLFERTHFNDVIQDELSSF